MTLDDLLPDDLPAWMRPHERSLDWGLLLVLGFALLTLWPFFVLPGLPRFTDADLYEYRSLEVARLVRSGIWYSRWAPDLNYALGSPLFNYVAPLPHYLTGYDQAITEITPVESVKLALCLSIIAATAGMFLFVRQRWGSRAGVLAALIYLYSPPISLTLPFLQGDLAPLMALSILPWVLWAFDRLWKAPVRRAILLATLLLAALILTDSRIAFLGVILLLVSLASARKESYRYAVIAIVSAIGITAYFWLPALLERASIHWESVAMPPYAGPIPLQDSLASIPRFAAQMLNAPVYRGMGVGTVILGLFGAGTLLWQALRKKLAKDKLVFLIAGLVFFLLSTPLFYWLWPSPQEFLPLLPYHALMFAIFCFAVVGAQSVYWLDGVNERWRTMGLITLCFLPAILSLPIIYLPELPTTTQDVTYLTALSDELNGYQIGTFRDGLLLPSDESALPEPATDLKAELQAGTFIRLGRQAASASDINILEHGLLHEVYYFQSSGTTTYQFYALDFPGWRVSVDGQTQPIQRSEEGLVSINVPPNGHELELRMEGTPLHALAWMISGISLLVLGVVVWRLAVGAPKPSRTLLPRREAVGLGLMLLVYSSGLVLWISQRSVLLALRPALDLNQNISRSEQFLPNGLVFVDYMLLSTTIQRGTSLSLSVIWQALKQLPVDYQSQVQLFDSGTQNVVLTVAHRHPGHLPTSSWAPDELVRDDFTASIPAALPPGDYGIRVAVANCKTHTLAPCEESQLESGNTITLPITIQVR